ncbi:MAG: hypothetical protein ACNFW9_06360 [Candidatus Kerfeldbacteria bacterium]
MFSYFLRKIKDFFIIKPRLAKFSVVVLVLVVAVGIFSFASPASAAGVGDYLADGISWLLLALAAFIGKLLVLVIGVLLEIVSYNDFTNSPAVEKGWIVLRDLCNLFFILILLVIAFGSILRLENYKYNKLLGKLVIMIILVNFSRMIAGFFIDVSQVVLLTFTNAFSGAAAANFTTGLKLKEMLNISGVNARSGGITATDLLSLSLLPVILLTVALFTMVAMVAVFLVRIIMLWVLIILSPLAYLLAVLPTTQKYSQQWWSNFVKWTVTGPILAFFIWFGLTLISGGDLVDINNSGTQLVNSGGSATAVNISNVSDSQSLLSFVMAIGMFIISLITAQSLGGMAGSMAGKALGGLKTMGAKALKYTSPALGVAKGAGELAKMGGRKLRREYRDSTLGKYTNIGATIAGAKKRGEEVESFSKERATAQGKEMWDKRPGFTGGGADVVPEVQMVERRYERKVAGEVSTLQKEQKSALLKKVWDKKGKQAEITRKALLQSLGAEGHIDDALDTDFFKNEAKWTDASGKSQNGFKDKNGNFDSNMARSNFMRATVSSGGQRSARVKDIDPNSLGTLYDIQQAGIRNDHFEYGGEVLTNPETGELALPETLGKDRMEHKNETIKGEVIKPTDRKRIGNHPHNTSVQKDSKAGDMMRLIPFKPDEMDKPADDAPQEEKDEYQDRVDMHTENKAQFDEFMHKSNYSKSNPKSFKEFSSSRLDQLLGKFDSEDGAMMIHDDDQFKDQIKTLYEEHPDFVNALQDKKGIKQWKIGKDGEKSGSLHDIAKKEGWKTNAAYLTPDEQQEEKDREKAKAKGEKDTSSFGTSIDDKQSSIDENRKKIDTKRAEAKKIKDASLFDDGALSEKDKVKTKTIEEEIVTIEKTIKKEESELTTMKTETPKTKTDKTKKTETERTENDHASNEATQNAAHSVDNIGDQMKGIPGLKISRDSMNEFEDLINKLTIDVNTGDGIDAGKFDKHIDNIGSQLSKVLSNVKPADKQQAMDNYKKASDQLQIGSVSEKTLQRRMIDSLNTLSGILRR